MMYVLTAVELTPGGSSAVHIYTQTMHRTTQQQEQYTQLSTPTHAQLQRRRLKFIKNHLKNSYMYRSTTIFRELQYPR